MLWQFSGVMKSMSKFLRGVVAFLLALAATYVVATAAATQSVIARLGDMGVDVDFGVRVSTTLHDQVGMLAAHVPLLLIALSLGFAICALVCRWLPGWRRAGYVLAGFVAVVAMHLIMRSVLELTPVAVARSVPGLVSQGLAGAIGGYVFYLVTSDSGAEAAANE